MISTEGRFFTSSAILYGLTCENGWKLFTVPRYGFPLYRMPNKRSPRVDVKIGEKPDRIGNSNNAASASRFLTNWEDRNLGVPGIFPLHTGMKLIQGTVLTDFLKKKSCAFGTLGISSWRKNKIRL